MMNKPGDRKGDGVLSAMMNKPGDRKGDVKQALLAVFEITFEFTGPITSKLEYLYRFY
jgi:hypothetical protein